MPEARVVRRARRATLAVLMLVVGAVHVYPDVRFVHDLGSDYKGIHFIAAVDETTYLSRLRRVLGGDYRLGNAMILEHRDDPFTYAPLPEYVVGTVGRLLGLSIARLDVVATFVLPAFVFLLFVGLVRELTGRRALSVIAGLVLIFGHYLIAKDSPLIHLRLYNPDFPFPLQFVRPVSPQFHYLVFVLALWLLYRVYVRGGARSAVVAAGAAWGLTFYLNFFFWTFLAVGIALSCAWAVVRGERDRWRAGVTVLAIGVAIGGYYLLNSYRVMSVPGFHEMSLRAGFIYARRPMLPVVHLAWLAVFGAWYWRHRESVPARFLFIFLVGGLICLNQQVVTGRTVQPFHWETQTNKLVMLLSAFVVIAGWLPSGRPRGVAPPRPSWGGGAARVGAGAIVIVVLFAHAILLQENYYRRNLGTYRDLQAVGPALAWLRRAPPADAVVLANPARPLLSELVAVYSGRFTYLSEPFFAVSLVPPREVDDRYMVAMRLFGFGEGGLRQVLDHGDGSLFLGIQVRSYYHRGDDQAIRRRLAAVIGRYRRIASGVEPLPPLGGFRLDYVLAGVDECPALRLDLLASAREVYSDGRFRVFAVSAQTAPGGGGKG